MFYDDHNEPHFHAYYGNDEAEFSIKTGQLLIGYLPRRARNMVKIWMEGHKKELLEDWMLAKAHKLLKQIKPLA